jgi:hypothetical protein
MELKFRAWDGKQFYYADMAELLDGYKASDFRVRSHEVENYPIELFTNRIDKNGVLFCQGDIILTKNRFYGSGKGIIRYHGWSFYIEQISGSELLFGSPEGEHWNDEETEVIGNIHEGEKIS